MKKFIPILLLALLVMPVVAVAQDDDEPDYPNVTETICDILEIIQNIILAVGLGLAVIFLIIGGIQYLTSSGNAEKADTAKKLIINAIIGIIIIFAAAFILGLVQGLLTEGGVSLLGNPCSEL